MSEEKKHKKKKQQSEQTPEDRPQELKEQIHDELDKLEKKNEDLMDKLRRVSADYANFQKRVPRQVADTVSYEKEKIIKQLLPAMDNFEHVLANAENTDDADAVAKGVKMVYDQMMDIFRSLGVEQIDAQGQDFNPSEHQAMMKQHDPEKDDNIVLEVFQRGYKLNDRVIRPSKVVVNKAEQHPAKPESGEKDDSTEE